MQDNETFESRVVDAVLAAVLEAGRRYPGATEHAEVEWHLLMERIRTGSHMLAAN